MRVAGTRQMASQRLWELGCYVLLAVVTAAVVSFGVEALPMAMLALVPLTGAIRLPPGRVLILSAVVTVAGLVIAAVQDTYEIFPDAGWRIVVILVTGAMATHMSRLRTDAERLSAQLREQADTDSLTGLSSRRAVLDRAEQLAAIRPQQRLPISVALLDVDKFKTINDTLGHQSGDDVLVEISRRVRNSLRTGDLAGRYGGEELLVVLPGDDEAGARCAVQRLLDTISAEPVATREGPVAVTVSAGLTAIAGQETTLDRAIGRADAALYRAKAEGRNRLAAEGHARQ